MAQLIPESNAGSNRAIQVIESSAPLMGGGGHRIQTPSNRGVIESAPPPMGGVIESRPIPYHLLATPLVIPPGDN